MGRGKLLKQQAKISAMILALSAGVAFAQTLDSPISGTVSLTSSVDANTNKFLDAASPGSTVDISERLSFSLITQNSIHLLEVSGSATLNFDDIGGGASADFQPPTVTLHYARDTGSSNLDASASFFNGTVVSSFDLDPTEAVFIIVDTGTLTTIGADLALSTGVNAPLGFSFTASYKDKDYDGTSPGNLALFDSTTTVVGASANLRLSPSTQGTLSASFTDYVSDDATATEKKTTEFNFSVSHESASALVLNANIGFREKQTIAGGPATTTSGLFGGVDLVRDMPNGSVFGGVRFDATGAANSATLTFGRTLELPNGSLNASLEANKTEGNSVQFLGKATYSQDMPTGSLSVNLNQSLSTNTLDQDIKVSTLGIDYDRALTGSSGLNLALDISRSQDAGAGAADTLNRATVSATYSQELTPGWDMLLGYKHRLSSGSAVATANSDSIFLTLTRSIQFGF